MRTELRAIERPQQAEWCVCRFFKRPNEPGHVWLRLKMFARTEYWSALSEYRGLVKTSDRSRTLVDDDKCYGFGGEGDSIYSLKSTTCFDILGND